MFADPAARFSFKAEQFGSPNEDIGHFWQHWLRRDDWFISNEDQGPRWGYHYYQ